jgi:calcineurin-like phosphoesterase family protein
MADLKQFKVDTQEIQYKRIFLLSDLHFGVRANSLEWLENQKSYFNNFYIPFLKENVQKGDILFILGDWFDNRQLLDIYVMNTSIDIVFDLSDILPVYFMTGNHDIYKKYDTDVNSIVAFKYIPNVTVYEKPLIITNNETKILLLPWIGNGETEENYARANKFDYMFAHADINGFKYDNGREIKNSSANFSKFRSIKKLFSGHIHKRQEIGNMIYIGSPYHTKRSDIGNTKGIYIFNPATDSFSFTLNEFSPIFQRIMLEGILELTLTDAIKLLKNNYTDIIVPDKYIHLFNLTKFIDILKNCNYKKIETVGERKKFEDELFDGMEGVDVRDILTLLEMSLQDLGHQMEVLVKLKLMNRRYYERASKEDIENGQ